MSEGICIWTTIQTHHLSGPNETVQNFSGSQKMLTFFGALCGPHAQSSRSTKSEKHDCRNVASRYDIRVTVSSLVPTCLRGNIIPVTNYYALGILVCELKGFGSKTYLCARQNGHLMIFRYVIIGFCSAFACPVLFTRPMGCPPIRLAVCHTDESSRGCSRVLKYAPAGKADTLEQPLGYCQDSTP